MTDPNANLRQESPSYVASVVDRIGPPAAYFCEERYLGYRDDDRSKPYAHYFQSEPRPLPPRVRNAVGAGPANQNDVVPLAGAARAMSKDGYLALETGYGIAADGHTCIACLTDMPSVDPPMWQWWFGWHLAESPRYKLWHPSAHVFAAPGERRSERRDLSDFQKYIGNVSYVDEYIGSRFMRLAVRFVEPQRLGFPADNANSITIVGRGGPSVAPITATWLIHQVRRTPDGAEMRSRFYVGPPRFLENVAPTETSQPESQRAEPAAADLLEHCGTEMNHLAAFLPRLYAEFGAGW